MVAGGLATILSYLVQSDYFFGLSSSRWSAPLLNSP